MKCIKVEEQKFTAFSIKITFETEQELLDLRCGVGNMYHSEELYKLLDKLCSN